ncbi:hypothetical protein BC834DRAFT_302268 [Gloeopeniophorella convolvens]|nr:hypothetical protein BC834DRAFT_302268 [Gloeopeniophorella convolvens]
MRSWYKTRVEDYISEQQPTTHLNLMFPGFITLIRVLGALRKRLLNEIAGGQPQPQEARAGRYQQEPYQNDGRYQQEPYQSDGRYQQQPYQSEGGGKSSRRRRRRRD